LPLADDLVSFTPCIFYGPAFDFGQNVVFPPINPKSILFKIGYKKTLKSKGSGDFTNKGLSFLEYGIKPN